MAPPAPPVLVPAAPTARHEEHNFRVLAVDDSPLMRTFLQNKLAPYGIHPEFAASGEEALFKISKQHYDLIFLDVMLPGMDGYDVCKMIKKNKDNALMKVVMLTSKDKTFDKIRGTMAGCDGYLTKPVDEMKLRAIIERHSVSPEMTLQREGTHHDRTRTHHATRLGAREPGPSPGHREMAGSQARGPRSRRLRQAARGLPLGSIRAHADRRRIPASRRPAVAVGAARQA